MVHPPGTVLDLGHGPAAACGMFPTGAVGRYLYPCQPDVRL